MIRSGGQTTVFEYASRGGPRGQPHAGNVIPWALCRKIMTVRQAKGQFQPPEKRSRDEPTGRGIERTWRQSIWWIFPAPTI